MLSTVCMAVVVLTQWLWMQPRRPPPLSSPLLHRLPHSSLFPPAQLLPLLHGTPSVLHLPPCPFPKGIALTRLPLPGWLLPQQAQVTEGLVSLDPLPALQDPLFPPTLQFLCHHLPPSLYPWAHLWVTTNPPLQPLLWCLLLPDWTLDRLPLLPGCLHLGI